MADQKNDQAPKRIALGKIVAPHGVKGLVKILIYGNDPALLENLPVYGSETGEQVLKIRLKNPLGKYILGEVETIKDRNAAEDIQGTELFIDKDKLPPIKKPGTYYYADLIGLEAFNIKNEPIGKIIAVENFGAGDLLEVKPSTSESFYVPFTKENVPTVDMKNGHVVLQEAEKWRGM